ncbi:MAG: caspase family protein [Bacteroidota bacterium]
MKSKIGILLLGILFIQVQTSWAQQDYTAFNTADMAVVFTDDFDNNANQWITDNLWISGQIGSGNYTVTCKNYQFSTGLSTRVVPVNPGIDYEIEADIKIIKGTGALVFGMTDKYDHYRVELSDNSTLEVLKDTPSKKKVEKLFSGSGNFQVNADFNKLTIRSAGGIYYIFINESLVGQFANIKPAGSQIGFNVGTGSQIAVNYLKVNEVKAKAAPLLAQNTAVQPAAKPAPPVITWFNPSKENTTLKSTNSSLIRARISSPGGVNSAVFYLNGVVYSYPELTASVSEPGVFIFEKNVNFDAGDNNIYLEVTNAGGKSTSEKRYFNIPAAVSPVSAPVAENTGNPSAGAPLVTWTSPSGSRTTLDNYNATVKATVRSASGLKSVLLYMNGISKGEADVKLVPGESGSFTIEKNLNFGPGENQIYLVATNSEGATKSDLRYFTNPFAVAPGIAWSNPTSPNTVTNNESLTIDACIKSTSDLRSVKLLVNGTIFSEDNVFQPSSSGDCNYLWQGSVVLRTGDNSVFLIATNIAGSTTSEKRVIKFEEALKEKRLALIFGNADYKNGTPLKNPVNDANLMEGTLKELGFDVIKRLNVGKSEMEYAIREFTEQLPKYNIALFYYAGHGNQVEGKNYLIPIDALLEKPSDCKFEAVAVDFIVEEFEKYQDNTNIVILDACRNNPYTAWARGGDSGFRAMNFSSGTIIAFATSEGSTAADGKGANGLFTEELVKQMTVPQSILSVFMNTRSQVRKLSSGAQTPTEWNKLNGDFYFKK